MFRASDEPTRVITAVWTCMSGNIRRKISYLKVIEEAV